MNKLEDLYLTLGVSSQASPEQIRLAYRRLARQVHPDHNPDDPQASQSFSKLTEAYRVLSDPQKRQAYDVFRKNNTSSSSRKDTGASLSAFFKKLFGSGGPLPEDGRDLKTNLTITLSDLVSGTMIHLEIPSTRPCSSCKGRTTIGDVPDADAQDCKECKGTGRQAYLNKLEVRIPAGLEDGTRLKISGEGEPGLRGGKDGDLFVQVEVKAHPMLSRQGRDLSCRVPITLGVALLGGEVEVPGPDKLLTLKVPAGTAEGKVMRLRGQGLPLSGGGRRGSLLVSIFVDMPTKLSKKQRSELREVLEKLDSDNYPQVRRFARLLKTLKNNQ